MANKQQSPQTLEAIVELVRTRYAGMSAQFQIAARYLIDNVSQVPVESMRSLASKAGVQPATMVRLAKSLGFDGWEGMRQIILHTLHATPRSYADQARDVVRRRSGRSLLNRHVAAQAANLRVLEDANEGGIREAARLLNRARHVHIAGFRASHSIAHTLYYMYCLFRRSVSLIRGDAGMLELELRALEPSDAVVIIGFAPYSREAMRVAEAAYDRGCKVVAICDSKVAPVAVHADVNLLFATDSPSFFPSTAPAIVLVEALANQLLGRAGSAAVEALGESEEQLHRSGAYLKPRPATAGPE